MSKNKEKERPGVVVRFEWLPTLEKLSETARAKFIMAALYRGLDISHEPDYEDLKDSPSDYYRFETLWEGAAPKIDEDGDGWKHGVTQRKYATYCREKKKNGEVPMLWEDYLIWLEKAKEKDIPLD